jgi:hypothetical protein
VAPVRNEEQILEKIRRRAHELYEQRREEAKEGDAFRDWLAAEAEVLAATKR